jgi:hypothetical protein
MRSEKESKGTRAQRENFSKKCAESRCLQDLKRL